MAVRSSPKRWVNSASNWSKKNPRKLIRRASISLRALRRCDNHHAQATLRQPLAFMDSNRGNSCLQFYDAPCREILQHPETTCRGEFVKRPSLSFVAEVHGKPISAGHAGFRSLRGPRAGMIFFKYTDKIPDIKEPSCPTLPSPVLLSDLAVQVQSHRF